MEEENLDGRGRSVTMVVVIVVVLIIAGVVANNYRIKGGWISAMKGYDTAARQRAAREMMERGDVAEQLQGEAPSVRAAAARALHEVGGPKAAENLIPFMKDSDQAIKDRAIQSLVDLGPQVSVQPVVEKGFSDSDDSVKGGSVQVCKALGAPAIVPAAAKLATDYRKTAADAEVEIKNKDGKLQPQIVQAAAPYVPVQNSLSGKANAEETRNQAIDVLDRAGDNSAVPVLIPALEFPQTRRAAVAALGRKKDLRATEPLIQWLGRDDTIRYELVIALGQIADPRAVQPLIREGLGSVSDPVRAAASDSLRAIGPPAIAALKSVAAGGASYTVAQRAGAVRALGGMKVPAATDGAIAALADPERAVREAAADALGASGDQRVIGPLAARFTDSDPDGRVRSAASRSLAAFGPRAVPAMVAALSSRDAARSYWAGQALLLIGHPAVASLTTLLAQGDPATAQQAAKLLGDLGDRSAAPALSQALQRNLGSEFRFAAQTALQRLSESAAGPSG